MKLITRAVATATAVLSISAMAMPVASAASTHNSKDNDNGKIRVCLDFERGGNSSVRVRVAGEGRAIVRDDSCVTFRGLDRNEDYTVKVVRVIDGRNRDCDLTGSDSRTVEAKRQARDAKVTFTGKCERD